MARKSIKGYSEKNYYDITRFNGGIVASNDYLNEGYFKHLVNFDIADTGLSLTPRKGFLTTTFKKDNITYMFNNDVIYFYDESLGEYIFFTFKGGEFNGVRCKFDTIKDNYLSDINVINQDLDSDTKDSTNKRLGCDTTGLMSLTGAPYISDNGEITPLYTNQAIRTVDEYNVVNYIIKAQIKQANGNIHKVYLKIYYRENKTTDEFEEDTLVLEYLDMNQVVNYVDTNYRNLAYGGSIIPNPMQVIYTDNIPDDHYDRLPMIYVKGSDGKYLINEIKNTDIYKDGFEVIPNFYIMQDDNINYTWGYTYEITSTGDTSNDPLIYKAPIYYITGNVYAELNSATTYIQYIIKNEYDLLELTHFVDLYNTNVNYDTYNTLINNLTFECSPYVLSEYILYIVPIPDNSVSEYTIDLSETGLLGPFGLFTHFSTSTVSYAPDGAEQGTEQDAPGAEAHNKHINIYHSLLHENYLYKHSEYSGNFDYISTTDLDSMLDSLKTLGLGIYVKKINDCVSLVEHEGGFQDCSETVLNSSIYSWDSAPMTVDEFIKSDLYIEVKSASIVHARTMMYTSKVCIKTLNPTTDLETYPVLAERLFSKIFKSNATELHYWWVYDIYEISEESAIYISNPLRTSYSTPFPSIFFTSSILSASEVLNAYYNKVTLHPYYSVFFWDNYADNPCTSIPIVYPVSNSLKPISNNITSLFKNTNNALIGTFNPSHPVYNTLLNKEFFDNGLLLSFTLLRIPKVPVVDIYNRDGLIAYMSKLYNTRQLVKTTKDPSTYIEHLIEDPALIANATEQLSYTSPLGSHLVIYTKNKLYISDPGLQYYFTQYNKFEYSEPIVKVIVYKDMLLVFTTQNLYAVHIEEVVTNVENGTYEDGNTRYIQQTSYEFRSHAVLYNLMVDKKYADAIQVYNQMVLFYSADGQMFLIKPTSAVDSDTRFSIQYFNKSANDILLNYKDYMQHRLQEYGNDAIIDSVEIKVEATINYIKIFYSAPGLITYILIYDVINNRYYAYDTIAFNHIKYIHNIPSGDLYITEHNSNFYFTLPYSNINITKTDGNIDISSYDNFSPFEICAEVDTGVINLNNHLKKRFRDLHVTYKNLNANYLDFTVESFVDDVPIIPFINSTFEVRSISGYDTLIVTDTRNVQQLVTSNNALFNFIDYTSNKLITHRTSIISKGKTIRVRMRFRSKGKYKIQGFGLIYKEHTV